MCVYIHLICHLVSPPVIIKQPTDEVAEVYSSITLECKVQGYGYINVEWRKLGAPLPNTAVVSNNTLTNGVSSILKIRKIVGYYDGLYCCVVNNIAGQVISMYARLLVQGKSYVFICNYCIASNYGRSCINTWSHLVAGGNSIITKINAGSRINAGFLWVHNNNYIYMVLLSLFLSSFSQQYDRRQTADDIAPLCYIIPCDL